MGKKLLKNVLSEIREIKNNIKETLSKECFNKNINEIINQLEHKEKLAENLIKTGIKVIFLTSDINKLEFFFKKINLELNPKDIKGELKIVLGNHSIEQLKEKNKIYLPNILTKRNEFPFEFTIVTIDTYLSNETYETTDYNLIIISACKKDENKAKEIIKYYKSINKKIDIIHNISIIGKNNENNVQLEYYDQIDWETLKNKIENMSTQKLYNILSKMGIEKEMKIIKNMITYIENKNGNIERIQEIKEELEDWFVKFVKMVSYEYSYETIRALTFENDTKQLEKIMKETNEKNNKYLRNVVRKKIEKSTELLNSDCLFKTIRKKEHLSKINIDFPKVHYRKVKLRMSRLTSNLKTVLKIMYKNLTIENLILIFILVILIWICNKLRSLPSFLINKTLVFVGFSIVADIIALIMINGKTIKSEIKINKLTFFKKFQTENIKKNSKSYFSNQIYKSLESKEKELREIYGEIIKEMKAKMNKELDKIYKIEESLLSFEEKYGRERKILRKEKEKWEEILKSRNAN